MRSAATLGLVLLASTSGCAHVVPPGDPSTSGRGSSEGSREVGPDASLQRGHASYYADSLAGHRTASGEPYDPNALTAAHRTLPFGTLVDVTRADGRSVRVRVNDRGPFGPKGRVIDLSRSAAAALGMIRDGVVEVTLRVVR